LSGQLIEGAALCGKKQVNGFPELARHIVLELGIRAARLIGEALRRLSPVVKAGQVNDGVAGPDQLAQPQGQWPVGECEVALLDRKDLQGQERVFDFPAITGQVARGRRDEYFRVLSHFSLEILSNSRAGSE
jgi:hypothetical protein